MYSIILYWQFTTFVLYVIVLYNALPWVVEFSTVLHWLVLHFLDFNIFPEIWFPKPADIYIYKPEDPISPRQLFVQPHGSGNLCQLWIVLAVSLGVGYVLMCKASSLIVPGDDNTPWLFWRHCRKTVLSAASGLGCDQDFLIPLHSGQEHTCTGYNNKWGFIASIWYFSQCHQSAAAIH